MSTLARWAITGSRNLNDRQLVWAVLDELARVHGCPHGIVVVNRGGVSRIAIDWGNANGTKVHIVRVAKDADGAVDRPATNAAVLSFLHQAHRRGRARVIAFPGNDWTYDLTRQAHRAGVPFDRVQINRVTGETRIAYNRQG